MFPPETIVKGAVRWLHLMRTSTFDQASEIIRADSTYTDLTLTQYASALDWLKELRVVDATSGIAPALGGIPDLQLRELLFMRAVKREAPAWLRDADVLVSDLADLPQDAASIASALGLPESVAFTVVRQVHGIVDTSDREALGRAGESALVQALEACWPNSTTHLSRTDDGFGYDVAFRHAGVEWHLEVKTTNRRGRLVIYLSRNEHEVGWRDGNWRLLVLGLDEAARLQAVATVSRKALAKRAPQDACYESRWQSVAHDLKRGDLVRGLDFLAPAADQKISDVEVILRKGSGTSSTEFLWMP